jgi:hypothetical protein
MSFAGEFIWDLEYCLLQKLDPRWKWSASAELFLTGLLACEESEGWRQS